MIKPRTEKKMHRPAPAIATAGTIAVLLHALVVIVHGQAHNKLHVDLSAYAGAFVFGVIVLGPLAALAAYWSGRRRTGAAALAATMAASFFFGLWNHFVVEGSDHVAHLPDAPWRLVFQISAWLLLGTEAAGTAFGIALLRRLER
jgi:hypothetical protein